MHLEFLAVFRFISGVLPSPFQMPTASLRIPGVNPHPGMDIILSASESISAPTAASLRG